VLEKYKSLDFESFTGLVGSFFGYDKNIDSEILPTEPKDEGTSSFAQRLITGLAAENYFESRQPELPEFKNYLMENTTRFGCGYDFRLRIDPNDSDFLAVEVKGPEGTDREPDNDPQGARCRIEAERPVLSLCRSELSRIAGSSDLPESAI
jgi:hypothetical protein